MKIAIFSSMLLISSVSAVPTLATHIRAGEITAIRQSCQGLTYQFTITGYEDTQSGVEFGDGLLSFGYSNADRLVEEAEFETREIIDSNKELRVTTFEIAHTFPGPGTYVVSYQESYRNEGILNMANSVNTDFYIETVVVIDPLFCNNTPILTNPPVDAAAVATTFLHNPGAYDPDGDSLVFKLVLPKQAPDTPVGGYEYPDAYDRDSGPNPNPVRQDGSTPVNLTLDPLTGLLTWDAPANVGEYNVAFIVEEWRLIGGEWIRLGYVTRDMQIIVEDSKNHPPEVVAVRDTCVEAGTLLEFNVIATDEDGDPVRVEAFGEPLELRASPATFAPPFSQVTPTPATGTFRWSTTCHQVRRKPYQVNFKATDVPTTNLPLPDFAVWNVTVVAPAPEGVVATLQDRSASLQWQSYSCADQAATLQVYRRIESNPFTSEVCSTGLPEGSGYTLVEELSPDLMGYGDTGLQPGLTYCYRLVAVYPDGSESYASEEVCVSLPATAPLMTKVSVLDTDPAIGRIAVAWVEPPEPDSVTFPGPYTYTLVRATGFNGTEGRAVVAENLSTNEWTDTNLNTTNQVYHYWVYLYDGAGQLVDSSATASSVRLEATPAAGSATLQWQADVPWSNQAEAYPYHYIYRNASSDTDPEAYVLLDSVLVTESGFTYLDQDLSDQQVYCYAVTTQGQYANQPTVPTPLLNQSQRVCVQPNDTVPPCSPQVLAFTLGDSEADCAALLADKPCNFNAFTNTLTWKRNEDACADDVNRYNIYFSATGTEDSPYERIATAVTDTFYVDGPLSSLAGCYRIAAVDRSGNESPWSEPICRDNCPYYELPNVFTPNGDGVNDTFQAYNEPFARCPRFVTQVQFWVYNRWGKEVYAYDSQENIERENRLFIHWDGTTHAGRKVSAGNYYYLAKVRFSGLEPNRRPREMKGWVQVMYDEAVGCLSPLKDWTTLK